MAHTPTPDPHHCNVAGCLNEAEGAVQLRFPKDWHRFLCREHLQPIMAALNEQLQAAHARV